jgi:hypothetical protein
MQPGDKDDGPTLDAVAILDAVIEHVAQEEAENGVPTEEDIRWSREVRLKVQARIAALRAQLTSARPSDPPAVPIGSDIRALDREGLLARLEAHRQGDGVRSDLASLSDEDLRRMLERLTEPTEGGTS